MTRERIHASNVTREEHLAECKRRALEYLDRGDVREGITSMLSDLTKHPETKHAADAMAAVGMLYIIEHDIAGARRFVEGFR